MDSPAFTPTRPYLIRAIYEWCTDNGFTPYVAVSVDEHVQVPREFVKDGEIVLNIGFEATSSLKLGNDFIEFKARFSGTAREIMVPVTQVMAIYARENGQGMSFPAGSTNSPSTMPSSFKNNVDVVEASVSDAARKPVKLASVERDQDGETDPPHPSSPVAKPSLKRVK